jgi:hypothetical protein
MQGCSLFYSIEADCGTLLFDVSNCGCLFIVPMLPTSHFLPVSRPDIVPAFRNKILHSFHCTCRSFGKWFYSQVEDWTLTFYEKAHEYSFTIMDTLLKLSPCVNKRPQ